MLLLRPGWAAAGHTDRECVSQAGPGPVGLLPSPGLPRAGVTRVPLPGHLQVQWRCPRAHCATPRAEQPPNFSVTAQAQPQCNLGVKQLQKNLLGDTGVWHQPWGSGPAGAPWQQHLWCPQVCGGHWAGWGNPWVRTVLAGAEVFHLPQFLLIKRMNYSSAA